MKTTPSAHTTLQSNVSRSAGGAGNVGLRIKAEGVVFLFTSCWESTVPKPVPRAPLRGDIATDTLIIGGGMAGILTAHRLQERGVPCVVLEGRTLGSGTTGHTTAKITAQHGLIYANLLQTLGPERAKRYYALQTRALAALEGLSMRFACDFEEKTAFTYTLADRAKLDQEVEAYRKLGIPSVFQQKPLLPFETAGALGMTGQAQFHPLKLLYALAESLTVYENSFVHRLDGATAYTEHGTVKAKRIILATHYPLVNIPGAYVLKLYQHRSYVLALEDAPPFLDMYVDDAPNGHSFRVYQKWLLLGGGDHRTGALGGGFEELRALAAEAYPAAQERFCWAAQDCMPLDDLPYIGTHRASAPELYVATGFRKWGMTGSMTAAILLTQLLTQGKSEDAELFAPNRSLLKPQLFLNALHSAAGLLGLGKRCSHMGCALKWNESEGSYDCPCHGSRFDKEGAILNGPAKRRISP